MATGRIVVTVALALAIVLDDGGVLAPLVGTYRTAATEAYRNFQGMISRSTLTILRRSTVEGLSTLGRFTVPRRFLELVDLLRQTVSPRPRTGYNPQPSRLRRARRQPAGSPPKARMIATTPKSALSSAQPEPALGQRSRNRRGRRARSRYSCCQRVRRNRASPWGVDPIQHS